MKKLLLVMLVPVLVLGIIGCAEGVTDTEVDAYIQGAFDGDDGTIGLVPAAAGLDDLILTISANQMTVRNTIKKISDPYRITFKRAGVMGKNQLLAGPTVTLGTTAIPAAINAAGTHIRDYLEGVLKLNVAAQGTFWDNNGAINAELKKFFNLSDADLVDFTGLDTSVAAVAAATGGINATLLGNLNILFPVTAKVIVGQLEMSKWEDSSKLATYNIVYSEDDTAAILAITGEKVEKGEEAFYKLGTDTIPKIGSYDSLIK